jgi:hypothetical protein
MLMKKDWECCRLLCVTEALKSETALSSPIFLRFERKQLEEKRKEQVVSNSQMGYDENVLVFDRW